MQNQLHWFFLLSISPVIKISGIGLRKKIQVVLKNFMFFLFFKKQHDQKSLRPSVLTEDRLNFLIVFNSICKLTTSL